MRNTAQTALLCQIFCYRADEAAVLADIVKRDERDRNRAVAPLKPAKDAYLLDNSHLDIEGGVRAAIDIVEAVRAGRL